MLSGMLVTGARIELLMRFYREHPRYREDGAGSYGVCGAVVGVGIAVSVLTDATPLTGGQRSLALGATSFALARMLDSRPRCCNRAKRLAVSATVDYLREHVEIGLPCTRQIICKYVPRNQECPRTLCPYYDSDTELSRT